MHIKAFDHNIQNKQSYEFTKKYKINKMKKVTLYPMFNLLTLRIVFLFLIPLSVQEQG